LEHIANPIKALKEWQRVLKSGGVVVLVVPHRDGHFDTGRPVTILEHMLMDYSKDVQEGDVQHLQEIVALHDFKLDKRFASCEDLINLLEKNSEHRMMHHHVFDPPTVIRLLDHVHLQIVSVDLVKPYNIVCMAQKLMDGAYPDNTRYFYPNVNDCKDVQFIFG
jgi:SAM-dependent methyltransferase